MDWTRYEDLKEVYHAKEEAKSVNEAEKLDKLLYDIKKQDDEELNAERAELAGAVRVKDGKHVRKVSERIKTMAQKKGMENG